MIHTLVISLAAMALVGTASWGAWSTVSGMVAAGRAERNAMRLDMAAGAVRANAFVSGGRVTLPAPSPDGNLPDWLGAEGVTPWGAAFRYCPYGEGVGGDPSSPNGYPIGTVTLGGRGYVVSSSPAPVAGLAFVLVSALPGSDAVPACGDVALAGGQLRVPGGTARGGSFDSLRHVGGGDATVYVSPAGGGTGRSASDPMTLSDAFAWWQAAKPGEFRIVMAPGTYLPPPRMAGDGRGSRIALVGPATIDGSIGLPVDLTLSRVSVTGALTILPGVRADLSSVSVGTLSVGGDARLSAGSSASSASAVAGGRIAVDGQAGATIGSAEARTGGVVSVSGPASVGSLYADTGGTASAYGGAAVASATAGLGGRVCVEGAGGWGCVGE